MLEGGNAELSADQYLALHAKQDAEFLKTATVDTGYRRARVHGDLAWVASLTEVQTEHEGKPLTIDGAESMVLKRVENGWRIVHFRLVVPRAARGTLMPKRTFLLILALLAATGLVLVAGCGERAPEGTTVLTR